MYLNKFNISFSKRTRVGRGIGSGLGKTCGKGHKGQKSRSGYSTRAIFEGGQTPLHIRLPKFGFSSLSKKYRAEVSSCAINSLNDTYVSLRVLKEKKLINNKIRFVKIIYSSDFNRAITFESLSMSKNVVLSIQKTGGVILN